MDLVVTQKQAIATDTVSIRLAQQKGRPLPPFEPGAHIEVSVDGRRRRYSLTSKTDGGEYYEIRVLRARSSRGGSAFINETLQVGDIVSVEGPFSTFALNVDARHSVFIAGGIGITPFYTMIDSLRAADRLFELYYTAKTVGRRLPLPEGAAHARVYPTEGDGQGLDIAQLLPRLDTESDLYVCGPRTLIEAVRHGATGLGWPRHSIHFESFGYAAQPKDQTIQVHLSQSKMTVDVQPGIPILDALLEAGVWAPFECRRGNAAHVRLK